MTTSKTIDTYVNIQLPETERSDALNVILMGMYRVRQKKRGDMMMMMMIYLCINDSFIYMQYLDVNSKRLELHQFVKMLGDYLQNRDNLLRSRGTLLLTEVLCRLPNLQLNEQQLSFFGEFYIDRLKDYACSSEVVKGIYALVAHHKLEYPYNQKMLRTLFSEVHPSSLPQTHRKMVLQIIDILFARHLAEIQAMGNDFMVGYLQFIDGEKDPRNLMFSFNLLPTVVRCIPQYASFADSLFEILSCYYPISFNPKQSDPNAITRVDLTSSLLKCFASTPLFAEHSVPFLLEKISANVVDTKIESMQTLVTCSLAYGAKAMAPLLEDVWGTLSNQILTHKNSQVIEESKKTIFQITRQLSTLPADKPILESFLNLINKECIHHIKTSQDSKLAVSCASILVQTISASVVSSRIVLSYILPHLLEFYNQLVLEIEQDPVHKSNEQISIVGLLNDLLKANILSFQTFYKNHQDEENPILSFSNRLYDLFLGLLSNQSILVRSLSLECLSNLYISIRSHKETDSGSSKNDEELILEKDKRQTIIKSFISLLNDFDDSLRTKSLDCLMTIAKNEQIEILNEYAIPTLLQMINTNNINNNNGDSSSSSTTLKETKNYLNAFTSLCTIKPLLASVMPHIQSLLLNNIKSKYISNESLESIFMKSIDESVIQNNYDHLLFGLISQLFIMILDNNSNSLYNSKLLPISIIIIHSIIQNINQSNQKQIIEKIIDIYINNNINLLNGLQHISSWEPFISSTQQQQLLIPIFSIILSQAKFDITNATDLISVEKVQQIQQSLFEKVIKSDISIASISCAQCLSAIVNKSTGNSNNNLIEKILPIINDNSNNTNKKEKLNALNLLVWITKAYLINGNSQSIQLGRVLSDMVSSPDQDISNRAAQSFDILLNEVELSETKQPSTTSNSNESIIISTITNLPILSSKSGAVIKVLHQQKFFTLMFPILLEAFKQSKLSQYLVAITNLLRNVSKEVLLSELGEVLPIVLQSLQQQQQQADQSQNQSQLLGSSLETLLMLVKDVPNSISPYLGSLIPSLITISTTGQLLTLRQSSLEVLTYLSKSLPYQKLYPYKQSVINGIKPALDDKKRLVRREATTCRNCWYILS
ncbi:putative DNA repair and transcription protein [Cavenderia fasciculata]|uniref:MMS19 nucleotide excision repair protein n=1 Tax=Cavenderia fasciculata TaxID=261658 RepID=F4Q2R9_CACFS|nr:putative DNA repair and transcription protein [Cavenderia fasciculata]EGG16695.1 putative DNA repair and transcription protein [Cavenderia fasciculata]|eukprot:XP_004355169.1 putative DNA repair and transcription protein [Cavenderia fasciculata]